MAVARHVSDDIAKILTRATLGMALILVPAAAWADCDGAREEVALAGVTDAFEFKLEDGRLVRLAGLEAPSVARARDATLAKAREDWGALADEGAAFFTPLAARPDRWGRWLGNLYFIDAPQKSYALALLADGGARVRTEFETRGCAPERLIAEQDAISKGLGLWADPDYGVRDGHDSAALGGLDGHFVVAEGVVRRVGVGRSRLYLDFGSRRDLSAIAGFKQEAAFLRAGVRLRDLKGARVRVRGVLDLRFAPRLDLTDAFALQVIEAAGAAR